MGTVLVVDDDLTINRMISHILGKAGHTVYSTDKPEEALGLAGDSEVDAAILDIMMPGTSGLDLLKNLRGDPALCHIPVLVLSSLNEAKDRVAGLQHGADDYLGKPFDLQELILRVERLIANGAARKRATGPTTSARSASGYGRYEIREVVGRGAMGTVYRAWDPTLKRWVALKTIRVDQEGITVDSGGLVSVLIDEAVSAAQINHPNVVTVYDADTAAAGPFIAMEFVEGPSLAVLLERQGQLPPGQAVALARALASALDAAHLQGILHHDVKPGNVLLGFDGAVKLSDFGLSGALSDIAHKDGLVFGTPGYMSPEHIRGKTPDGRSDLFALGVILYSCVTSWQPFSGPSLRDIVAATLNHVPPPPTEFLPEISGGLSALIMQLLEQDPDRRPRNASQLLTQLEALEAEPWDPKLLLRFDGEQKRLEPSTMHACTLRMGE